MKKTALTFLFIAACISPAAADDTIKEAMKKYHKPEIALAKKVGKGEATPDDLTQLLKCYEGMKAAKPARGDQSAWEAKCDALISAVKKVQANDSTGISEFKKAVNCKACHDVHKGK